MKSFQGNVLPFYLYRLLEPKRERIWLSLNHFREILLHYIIIYHAVQLSLLQNCIHNFKIIPKINEYCTTVAKRMVTEATNKSQENSSINSLKLWEAGFQTKIHVTEGASY